MSSDPSRPGVEAWRVGLLTHAIDAVSQPVLIGQADGTLVYANPAMERLLGSEPGGLAGANAWELLALPEDRERVRDAVGEPLADTHVLVRVGVRTRSGAVVPVELTLTVFRDEASGAELGIAIARDLREQNRAEAERAMRERQLALMLREAHHRIKNTLQVASDILALQGSASSPEVREALGAAAGRIRALAAVHGGIRADQDVTRVQVQPLISAVVQDLRDSAASSPSVSFEITLEEHPVPSRAASGLALIAIELVANALEHGRPETVRIRFQVADAVAVLDVCDDGRDDPPSVEAHIPGFGLRLVRLLAEEQLRGTFSLGRSESWTVARVSFPVPAD
ncbi:MAG: PAS domain S-box protein [Armatimonadetes bacterium]|nr:PAS domain S-box protein [Armatimonadota bacterium]